VSKDKRCHFYRFFALKKSAIFLISILADNIVSMVGRETLEQAYGKA
jgi:hypothetical protein